MNIDSVVEINAGGKLFSTTYGTISKSNILKALVDNYNESDKAMYLDEDPKLFEHMLNYMRYWGNFKSRYVVPKNDNDNVMLLLEYYEVNKGLNIEGGTYTKTLWYIEKTREYVDIADDEGVVKREQVGMVNYNKAFAAAYEESGYILDNIYQKGVDINFDIADNYNMYTSAIDRCRSCSPDFLYFMKNNGRKDIYIKGQKVFEQACAYGYPQHIEFFMDIRDKIENFNVYAGAIAAVNNNKYSNLHSLKLYMPVKEIFKDMEELVDVSLGISSKYNDFLSKTGYMCVRYLVVLMGGKITKDQFKKCLGTNTANDLGHIIDMYLDQEDTEVFDLDEEDVKNILCGTEHALYKLEYLNCKGFIVQNLEELKIKEEKGELPAPKVTSYRVIRGN